jgi:hypothetical protein
MDPHNNRVIPDEALTQHYDVISRTTIDPQVRAGIERAKNEPDKWIVCKGPMNVKSSRVRASEANSRRRWGSLTTGEPLEFRSWTDPENGMGHVLVRYNSDRDNWTEDDSE